ncbi:hypothetical protein NL676_009703 [Syzygium grande]|nr:hypothetical protein NL676_009703 [Syzygium grande]
MLAARRSRSLQVHLSVSKGIVVARMKGEVGEGARAGGLGEKEKVVGRCDILLPDDEESSNNGMELSRNENGLPEWRES